MSTDKQINDLLLKMNWWLRLKVIWYSHFNLDKSLELTKQFIKEKGKESGWELLPIPNEGEKDDKTN